jgi:hypothetical protein
MFHLKSKLRFLELPQAAFLNVMFGEEESGAYTSSTSANASKDE